MTVLNHRQREVFSAKKAARLDTRLRRFLYRPDYIARRYIRPGDRVLDFGCGPGFFTREFARQTGQNGMVYAVDLQEEMLAMVREKMVAEGLLAQVRTHRCRPDSIGLPPDLDGTIDFASAIFVVHEVPDPEKLFREITSLLKTGGTFFLTEPPFEVSGREFREKVALAEEAGLRLRDRYLYFVNRAVVLVKE